MPFIDYKLEQHQRFVGRLVDLLKVDPETAEALGELFEDRMKELARDELEDHTMSYEHTSRDRY